jgi:NitT/TauT family transport system permease protein
MSDAAFGEKPARERISVPGTAEPSLRSPLTRKDSSRVRRRYRQLGPPFLGLALILTVWQVGLAIANVQSWFLPKPSDVFQAVVSDPALLLEAALRTALASVLGLGFAIVLGMAAAVVFSLSRALASAFFPYAIVMQTTPVVAIAPVIVIWIGPGLRSIVIIAFIISFFPMLSNTFVGLNSADLEARNLFQLYGASKWVTMWKLRLPGAMPFIMAGIRISTGLCVIGAIVGEFVAGVGGGQGGLGYVIQVAAVRLETPLLFAGALCGSCLGLVFHAGGNWVSRRVLTWHESSLHIDLEKRGEGAG